MSNAATPFPLGAYLGNPDQSSAAGEAAFETNYNSFTATLGAAPQYLDVYTDFTVPVSEWIESATWQASSNALSPDAKGLTPVIGMAMASTAAGSLSADQQFQAFASGQYDQVINGMVKAWAAEGFKTQIWRPGVEFNLPTSPSYATGDAQTQTDWVKAFQHIYTELHVAAQQYGVTLQVVWNPGTTNYSVAEATTSLYPGNSYVDVIGADAYGDMAPYADGTNAYHDWATGGEDSTVAQFIANPVNREHYWSNPAANEWSSDASEGHSQSLASLIQFAEQQGKPFALPETGAGNSQDGSDVTDEAAFPQWLAAQLHTAQAAGEKIEFADLWDSNSGGNYEFSNASDDKPLEAAAWAKYFGSQAVTDPTGSLTVGTGPNTLALQVSEDAFEGNAEFTVSVDGKQIGGVLSATAPHAAGQDQTVNVLGTFAAGSHALTVDFLNDLYEPGVGDRNLYVTSATIDSSVIAGGSLTLVSGGLKSMSFISPATTIGSGSQTLGLQLSEEAFEGNAQFTVSVDGKVIGGTLTATASHGAGATQLVSVLDTLASGSHVLGIDFLNDAYVPGVGDKNLYLDSATLGGATLPGSALTLLSSGSQYVHFTVPATAT